MPYVNKYSCGEPVRRPPPKDGPGPRGFPDVYYTSRINNATFRYARFIKKLRETEEEQRKGNENKAQKLKDQQILDFFIRCDRRSLINNVSHRVDLCLQSYEDDLAKKRTRLADLLKKEEERDVRLFVEQAQAATDIIWQEKLERLEYLLAKRRKEHEEKYKDLPISKCVHALPCIFKKHARDAQDIQLYQMKEKESIRESEREMDRMWYEVAMKEAEALTARMEVETIERYRQAMECKKHSDKYMELKKKQDEANREKLKLEALAWRKKCEDDLKKEAEEEAARRAKRMAVGKDRMEAIEERRRMVEKLAAEEKLINETWDSLTGQGLGADKEAIALRRRKEEELDICNRKLAQQRDQCVTDTPEANAMIEAEAKRQQDLIDKKRCDYLLWSQKTNKEVRQAMIDQITERKKTKEDLKKKLYEEEEYQKQTLAQSGALIAYKEQERARARKQHQRDLLQQIEYNKLLKERAFKEELEQRKKAEIVAKEYQEEINRMVCRQFYQDDIHPFMKKMIYARPIKKCPCSKPDYCK